MDLADNLAHARALDSPLQRAVLLGEILRAWPQLHAQVRAERQEAVQQMRGAGMSWGQIGEALGVHRSRAKQIAEGDTGSHRRADDAGAAPD